MGETKWTPGPWEAEQDTPHQYWWVHADRTNIACHVGRANAALIAAAPTQHEALTWLLPAFKSLLAGKPVRNADEVIAFAERAISLAHVSPQAVSENGNVQGVK